MTSFKTGLTVVALAAAFGAVSFLSHPVDTAAYKLLGGSLPTDQRDFRIYNNFSDSGANNNTNPHPNFPGAFGAVMSIWKAHVEWASEPYAGNGQGDGSSVNPVLGSGGANFDNIYQGEHDQAGGSNGNIHGALAGSSGSTLAYMNPGVGLFDGWEIRYYETWNWRDGPGTVTSGADIQGVACHEVGHSLGLDHSTAGGPVPTMRSFVQGTGNNQRSIEADDAAGIQAVYGVRSATKPSISGLAGSTTIGQVLTLVGSNFDPTDNEVWFTKASSNGVPVMVTGLPSGGGTQINVTVPAGIQDGEVMVKVPGTSGASLSNAFPITLGGGSPTPPLAASLNPGFGPQSGLGSVVITGSGLNGVDSVTFDGTPALDVRVDSDTSMTVTTPAGPLGALVDVVIADAYGSDTLVAAYTFTADPQPALTAVTPAVGSELGGEVVTVTGASVVGVTEVRFDGVPGTDLTLLAADTLEVTTPALTPGLADVTALGNGNDTLVDAYEVLNEPAGAFVPFGAGFGSLIFIPGLNGVGDLTPGGQGAEISITSGRPGALGTLFFSFGDGTGVPFKSGEFYALPIATSINLQLTLAGALTIPLTPPAEVVGPVDVVLQWLGADAFAPGGVSGSNGLRLEIP